MFATRGFDNVTVAEVAEVAEVSKMTVFNYFPRKEDLFWGYQHELLATGHPLSGVIEHLAPFIRIVRASPALMNRALEFNREIEQTLARTLAAEVADDVRARLIAGQLAAALESIYAIAVDRTLVGGDLEVIRQEQASVIDAAFDLLEGGIGGYGLDQV